MPKIIFILFFFITMTGGCSLHEIRTPQTPDSMPSRFSARKAIKEIQLEQWWKIFNDTELNKMMEKCFAENLDIQQAVSRLRQAHIQYQQSGTALLPEVSFKVSGSRQTIPTGKTYVTDNSFSASFAASYELDLWKKIASSQQAAAFRKQATYEEIRSLYLSLSAQIAQTWYKRQEIVIRLKLLDKITLLYQDRLNQIEQLYERGLIDSDRLYQARQVNDITAIRRPTIEADLSRSDNTLAMLIGAWAGSIRPDNLKQLPDVTQSFPSGLPADLLMNRPDVAAAFARLQAADNDIAVAIAKRFPSIKLTAAYGRNGNETANLLDIDYTFWNFIGGLTQPLFDAGRAKQDVAHKKESYTEQLLICQKSLMQAYADVINAIRAEQAADMVINLQDKRLKNSLRNRQLTQTRYEQGLASYLDLTDLKIQHLENRLSHLTATLQRITARISLAKALGGNWMDKTIEQHLNTNQVHQNE